MDPIIAGSGGNTGGTSAAIPPQSVLNKEKSINSAETTVVSPTQPLPLKFTSSLESSLQNQTIRECFHDLLNKQAFHDLDQCLAEDVQYVNRSSAHQASQGAKKGLSEVKIRLMEDALKFNQADLVLLKQASEGNCIFTEYGRLQDETVKLVEILELNISTDKITRIEMINLGDKTDSNMSPPSTSVESDGDIAKLQSSIMGRVVTPKSPDYQEQVAMAMKGIDTAPAVMIQCLGTNDVIQAIRFSQEFERKAAPAGVPRTAVRGGGHSFSGTSTNVGGCVIDLRKMRSVVVDPKNKTAWVDGGATVGDLDREAFLYGLVMPTGQVSHTGIGGLASCGGGYGLLTHRFGVMTDSLLALEMVLADGTVVQYSKEDDNDDNKELFAMCREGSRWLGVVTRFKFQLYELPAKETCNTVMLWDVKHFQKCFQAYRALPSKDAIAMLAIVSPPPELLPPNTETKTVVFLHMIVFGDAAKAKAVETSLIQDIGEGPLVTALPLAPRPWPEINSSIDFILPFGIPTYAKGFEIEDDNPEKEDKALKFIEKLIQERPLTVAVDFNWTMGQYVRNGATTNGNTQSRKPVFYCAIINFLDPANLGETKQRAREFAARFLKQCEEAKLINNSSRYYNFTETYQSTPFTAEHISTDIHQRFMKVKQRLDPTGFFGKAGI